MQMDLPTGATYLPSWEDFKAKMLTQLGTPYKRRVAAHRAIKTCTQLLTQGPSALLNYLRPLWDEVNEDRSLNQTLNFYNAL